MPRRLSFTYKNCKKNQNTKKQEQAGVRNWNKSPVFAPQRPASLVPRVSYELRAFLSTLFLQLLLCIHLHGKKLAVCLCFILVAKPEIRFHVVAMETSSVNGSEIKTVELGWYRLAPKQRREEVRRWKKKNKKSLLWGPKGGGGRGGAKGCGSGL